MNAPIPFAPLTKAPTVAQPSWSNLLQRKIVELSGHTGTARFTYATHLLIQAQAMGETTAWIQPRGGRLYPPDLEASGVDLASLVVIQVPAQAGPFGVPKAAEILLRSGAYGLVVLDLLAGVPPSGAAWQGRLLSLARQHQSGVVIITHKPPHADSLGALCSWRLEPSRQQSHQGYAVAPVVRKNKSGGCWPDEFLACGTPW